VQRVRTAEVDVAGLRTAGAVMLGAALVWPALPAGTAFACPFHALTGVPCPLCGMTRSVVATVHLQLDRALAMNPAGIVAVAVAVVLLVAAPRIPRQLSFPAWAPFAGLAALWSFQLLRLPFT
jgi:hypothetical protein